MAADVIPLRRPLTTDEAATIVSECVGTDRLGWTDHIDDSIEQRGISSRQVMAVLKDGELKKGPTWSDKYQDWVCVFHRSTCGRRVRVVVGIDADRKAVSVVTAY